MNNINFLNIENIEVFNTFMSRYRNELSYFEDIGWNKKAIYKQLKKENNFSLGYFEKNELEGILVGDLLKIENSYELQIYILFVSKKMRRNKLASNMLKYIEFSQTLIKVSKIFLEVSEKNFDAIAFYKKNNFVFSGFRPNYYRVKNKTFNALTLFKEI